MHRLGRASAKDDDEPVGYHCTGVTGACRGPQLFLVLWSDGGPSVRICMPSISICPQSVGCHKRNAAVPMSYTKISFSSSHPPIT